jgi:hypothetical protein
MLKIQELRRQESVYRMKIQMLITKAPFDSAQDRRKLESTDEQGLIYYLVPIQKWVMV